MGHRVLCERKNSLPSSKKNQKKQFVLLQPPPRLPLRPQHRVLCERKNSLPSSKKKTVCPPPTSSSPPTTASTPGPMREKKQFALLKKKNSLPPSNLLLASHYGLDTGSYAREKTVCPP